MSGDDQEVRAVGRKASKETMRQRQVLGVTTESVWQQFARGIYTGLMLALLPIIALYLIHRARKQPEYLKGWGTRFFGVIKSKLATNPFPPVRLQVDLGSQGGSGNVRIWVHAVSVGETHAVAPLVFALSKSHHDIEWVFSSTTPTGQETAKSLFATLPCAEFVYLPYDIPCNLMRFIRAIRPSLLCLVETELWPNLLAVCERVNVPVALVNARVSPRTARRLAQLSALSRPAVARLSLLVTQTQADAASFANLGRQADVVAGNMKFDMVPSVEKLTLGRQWREHLPSSKGVVLFASSREGEEALFLEAWQRCTQAANPSVLIVPRHPQRFDEVAQLAKVMGYKVRRRSDQWGLRLSESGGAPLVENEGRGGREPSDDSNKPVLYLGDSMGEMPAYYALADVALIGGSWLPFGGQNLIEACACACPVVFGPHTFNFKLAALDALSAGAGQRFQTLDEAVPAVVSMLGAAELQAWRNKALAYFQTHQGATQRTLDALLPLLLD